MESISFRLWIHSYSPNCVSKVPSCSQRIFRVKRGPSSCGDKAGFVLPFGTKKKLCRGRKWYWGRGGGGVILTVHGLTCSTIIPSRNRASRDVRAGRVLPQHLIKAVGVAQRKICESCFSGLFGRGPGVVHHRVGSENVPGKKARGCDTRNEHRQGACTLPKRGRRLAFRSKEGSTS